MGEYAWRSASCTRKACATATGISVASMASMRWPALWPSGTAFTAAWVMFSAQPKAKLSRQSWALAAVNDAARANATGYTGDEQARLFHRNAERLYNVAAA